MVLTPVICGSCKATAEVNLLTTAACGNCGSDDLDFFEGARNPLDIPPNPTLYPNMKGYPEDMRTRIGNVCLRCNSHMSEPGHGIVHKEGCPHYTQEDARLQGLASMRTANATPHGEVRVWADGFGTWHASVALDDHSINAAQRPEVAEAALDAIRGELHARSNGRTSGGPAAYDPATTGVKFEGASNSPDGQYLAYFVETNIHDASVHEAAKGRYVVRHDKYGDSYHHQTIELARRERDHPQTVPAGEWYIWDRIEKRRVDDDETDQHKQAELGEPERQMCPRCGTAQYNPAVGYCPQCGYRKTAAMPPNWERNPNIVGKATCPTCGDEVPVPETLVRNTGRFICSNGHSFPYRKTGSVPDTRTDEWDGIDPPEPFPEPTTFGSLRVEADEDIATTIRGVLKKDDEFGYAVPADLVDALDDGEVKGAWMKLIHSPMPPSYNDMSMGPQHAVRNWARAIVTNILIDRHGRKGYGSLNVQAAYPPEGSQVRHASPQAWRRLREQMQEVELRDIARDIASVAGGDSRKIADALIHHDWQEGYHQGSLQAEAAAPIIIPDNVGARDFSPAECGRQIGNGNILSISGGRILPIAAKDGHYVGVSLPVSNGYAVNIFLANDDTYTVQRVYRGNVKGEMTDIYAEQLGEVAYQAGMFQSNDFGGHVVGSLQTVAYPKGKTDYHPSTRREGEPSPQTHPNKFSDEDIVTEVKHLMKLNGDYEATGGNPTDTPNIRRTLAYTKLIKVLNDRKKKRGSLQRMAVTDDMLQATGGHEDHVRWLMHQYALDHEAAEAEAQRRYEQYPDESKRWSSLQTDAAEHCAFPGCTNSRRGGSTYCHMHDIWLQHLREVNAAKVAEITAGILETNPGMNFSAAAALAVKTIERFPKLAGSVEDDWEKTVLEPPLTENEAADHVEMDHEREVAPGTTNIRSMHRQMHNDRDWEHRHAR